MGKKTTYSTHEIEAMVSKLQPKYQIYIHETIRMFLEMQNNINKSPAK